MAESGREGVSRNVTSNAPHRFPPQDIVKHKMQEAEAGFKFGNTEKSPHAPAIVNRSLLRQAFAGVADDLGRFR